MRWLWAGLLLVASAAGAQEAKKNPLDPQMSAVSEACFQGNAVACIGTADAIEPGPEAWVLWSLGRQHATQFPEQFEGIEGFGAETAIAFATQQMEAIAAEPQARCQAAVLGGAEGEPLRAACNDYYKLLTASCFAGIGADCWTVGVGVATGAASEPDDGGAWAWAVDGCSLLDQESCKVLGANPFPMPPGYGNRDNVLRSPKITAAVREASGADGGPDDPLPFDADLLNQLGPTGAGVTVAAWLRMAKPLFDARAAGQEVDRDAEILQWTAARCDAGEAVYCRILGDIGLRPTRAGGVGMATVVWLESVCSMATSLGSPKPTSANAQSMPGYVSCRLSEQVGRRARLVPTPLFDDHKSLLRMSWETIRLTQGNSISWTPNQEPGSSASSGSSSSSSSTPTASTSTTSTSSRRSSKFGLSGYIGFGGIRSWTHKTQASGFNVGVRPRIGPVAFDVEWNWMSDRRWKAANKTYERQALQFRVHPGIPLLRGLSLRIGGGGQFGSWRGRNGEGPTLGGGANEIIELNYGFSGKGTFWLAARIEQQQWFGDVRGQSVDHVTVASFLIGGGL